MCIVNYVVNLLDHTPIFEWCKARLVVKNEHPKDTCHYEIGVYAQDTIIIPGSIVDIIGMASMIS